MGLTYPDDLQAWQAWQARRNLLRTAKTRVRGGLRRTPEEPASLVLHRRGSRPRLLAAVETASPTQFAAVVRPLDHLPETDLLVLATQDLAHLLPGTGWSTLRIPGTLPGLRDALAGHEGVRDVLSVGHYLPVGSLVDAWRTGTGARSWVVQHGLLVPMAPPLPREVRLLAFSDADAAFWSRGRDDIETRAVGSQLLWSASGLPPARTDPSVRPVYLGQLHGAELSRVGLARSSYAFCREHDAEYRPHPGETDVLSRAVHALWARRGIRIQQDPPPLSQVRAPVVSAFSTGILEAAARGLEAWAHHRNPPTWLEELWERYGMSRWGEEPTPAPQVPGIEPARQAVDLLRAQWERPSR